MRNAIGEHEFLILSGQPDPPRKACAVMQRAGVPGTAVWTDAPRGRPFRMRSVVDVLDLPVGRQTYKQYCDTIGTDPVPLVWEDVEMTGEDWKVIVLDVRLIDLHAIETPVGGFDEASRARLECEWDLIAVATNDE